MAKEIDLPEFKVGMAIEANYITPDDGRPVTDLKDADGNIVLRVANRWGEKVVVCNNHSGGWGEEERPEGFDFSAGVPISIRIEAYDDHFNILVNGKLLHQFKHRHPVSCICKLSWDYLHGDGATKKAKLINLGVFY